MTVYNVRPNGQSAGSRMRMCARCGHLNAPSYLACESCQNILSGSKWVNAPAAPQANNPVRTEAPRSNSVSFGPTQSGGEDSEPAKPSFFGRRSTGHLNVSPSDSVAPAPSVRQPSADSAPANNVIEMPIFPNGAAQPAASVEADTDKTQTAETVRSEVRSTMETIAVKTAALPRKEGTPVFESSMLLCIEIGNSTVPLVLRLPQKRPLVLGRDDPESGERPDIDLIPYGGFQKGISRRHASVELYGKRLLIRDLKSSNGTFLNDVPLDAHESHQLRDGDVIRLGSMTLKMSFKQ